VIEKSCNDSPTPAVAQRLHPIPAPRPLSHATVSDKVLCRAYLAISGAAIANQNASPIRLVATR
jgi:hypothetical protein